MQPQETLKGQTAAPSTIAAPDEAPQIQAAVPDATLTVGEERPHRLASEQAEVERLASLEKEHAIKTSPATKRYYKVKVRDGGTRGEQAEYTARCSVGSMDLSTWMVRQGWAKPKAATEPALADASEAAKQAHLGIWRAGE